MSRKLLFLFIVSFLSAKLSAQSSVSGTVKDTSSNTAVKNAVVSLLTPKDSILKSFARVNEDGSYILKDVPQGNYILTITHPVFGDFVDNIQVKSANEKLAMIALTPKAKLLEAVLVKTGSAIKLRGDTTVFTADSFRVSANANVEELLKKLPGVQVDKNGEIKAMGQTVQTVLVDGEEFFGDDPGMAVKNLRADAVKEVQVFDKKSEQSEFTGIDDGKTKKTINLKLKENKKRGYFGKIDMAGGPLKKIDDRYNTNLLYSSFKGKRKLSGFLLTGNTGQNGMNWQDEQKYGGGNDNMSFNMDDEGMNMFNWRGGASSDEEPILEPDNGFITNINAGGQYSNKFHDKTTVNFSPKYNSQRYNNHKETYTQSPVGDSLFISNSAGDTYINRHNVKLRGIIDTKLDSANTLKITANANFYNTESRETRSSLTTGETGTLKNSSQRNISTNSDKEAYSLNAILKHKFKKARRTISVTADMYLLNSEGVNFLRSDNRDYFLNSSQVIDQMKDYEKKTNNASSKIVYTEPLGKKYALELGYQVSFNHGSNDQVTYRQSNVPAKYDTRIDSLSNQFRQNIVQHIPSAKINYSYKKLKVNVGAGISLTDFELKDLSYATVYNRNYTNFYPTANLNYTYKANHNLVFAYSGVTTQPKIDQLQPLRNNNDQFNQYIGNPDLKPSFNNNFNLSHGSYNFLKDIWMYQSLNLNIVNNSITTSRTVNTGNGKTISQPVNTNGNINLNFWGGTGFKVKKIDTRFGFNTNAGYNRFADIVNGVKSFSDNVNLGLSANVQKSKDKKYDFTVSNSVNRNFQKNSQNNTRVSFITNTLNISSTIYYKKVWSIETEYELLSRQKTAQVPGLSNNILNAKLQRTFKKDEYSIYLMVSDLLNENIGIDRNFSGTTFTETRNDRLKRYFMLGFRWDFKNKPAKAK